MIINYKKYKKKDFDQLILKSIKTNYHIKHNSVYYDDKYLKSLRNELKKRNILNKYESNELKEVSLGKIKMCSVASSSRLCFLYLSTIENIKFEYSLPTGVKGGHQHPAQLDAFDKKNNIFYECKCHEIFDNHNGHKLSNSYKNLLKEFFEIDHTNKKDKFLNITKDKFLKITLEDFEIKDIKLENEIIYSSKQAIYDLKFDMKQLLCHLFALAKNKGGKLQYIFFIPNKNLIGKEENIWCDKLYKILDKEIESIFNSPKIKEMCVKNNIELLSPLKIEVSKIEDFVLNNIK